MSDPQSPGVDEPVADVEAAVGEDEDHDLANASEWGDDEEDETMEEAAPNAESTLPADEGSIPEIDDPANDALPSQQQHQQQEEMEQQQQAHQQTKQQRREKKKLKQPVAGTLGVEDDYDNEDADEDADGEDTESEEEETDGTDGLAAGGGGSSSAAAAAAEDDQQPGEAVGGVDGEQLAAQDAAAPERILGAHELWRQKLCFNRAFRLEIKELSVRLKGLEHIQGNGVLGQLLDEQEDRFEHFRRSAIDKGKMKKILGALTSATYRDNVATALCGISKLYVGELIEAARVVATQESHVGALQPHHIRTAYQRLLLRAKGGVQKQALRGRLLR